MLTVGNKYIVKVLSIQHNAESFPKTGTGEMVHCHFIDVARVDGIAGESISTQLCTSEARVSTFSEGDSIEITCSKLAKSRFTVRLERIVSRGQVESVHEEVALNVPAGANFMSYQLNPYVQGTAMERAIAHAVHLHQMSAPLDIDKVEETARRLYVLMKDSSSE